MAHARGTPNRPSMFSDGVFAVLITVLVLELRPPELPTFSNPGRTYGKHGKSLLSACHSGVHEGELRYKSIASRISHLSRARDFRSRYLRRDRWTRERAYVSHNPRCKTL